MNELCKNCAFLIPEDEETTEYCKAQHTKTWTYGKACELYVADTEKNPEKALFVRQLWKFYRTKAANTRQIKNMYYKNEYVVVEFNNGKKSFSVDGDNKDGILIDFVRFLMNFDSYEWEREK